MNVLSKIFNLVLTMYIAINFNRNSQTGEIAVDKFMWIPGFFMDLLYLGEPDIV
jgi:hypothetical protein